MERLYCNNFNKDREEKNLDLFQNVNEEVISDIKQTPLQANCRLEVHIESKNRVIYVRSCRAQYFLLSSSKCYENINIKYIGDNYNENLSKICGSIGNYYLLNAGILLVSKRRIRPGAIDILPLVAYDGYNYYKFEAIFNYVPYECRDK